MGPWGPQKERSEGLGLELHAAEDAKETSEKGILCNLIFMTVFFLMQRNMVNLGINFLKIKVRFFFFF